MRVSVLRSLVCSAANFCSPPKETTLSDGLCIGSRQPSQIALGTFENEADLTLLVIVLSFTYAEPLDW